MPATVKTVIDQKAFLDSVQKGVDMANRRVKSSANKIKLSIDEKGFRQPLGRITGDLKMFDSALAASNARVIAFGASTAVIGGISKAFKELARTTIEVEKQFADINRILQVSNKNFEKFGNQLFEIGKKNATSFQDTTKAALEFARQGLKVEDTLKRTSDALTLVRLTGINADKAVSTLTATVNAFESSMLDTTTAVNKFVAVETKFAVGARDLVEAIGRVGSSAIDAKVGFDELNAMVTSVQQTTGRGGAVIGNAMKTIFTRLQRQSTLEALESYNVAVRDISGNTLPAIQILNNFAQSYAGLTDSSQAYLREQVAGVFQANILSAILKDLNKQQSTYGRALDVSTKATNEADMATAELNRTLSALVSQTGLEFQKLQQNIGKATFEPIAKELLTPLKGLMQGINDVIDGEGAGSEIANGLLKGLRNILGGPGLVAAIGLIGKVFLNTTSYIVKSLPALAGITTETQKRANLEKTIQGIMERESVLASAIDGFTGDTAAQTSLIANYAELAAQDMERQDKAVKSMAATLRTMPGALTALSKTTGGTQLGQPKAPRGASGFIPGMAGEVHDIRRGVGGVSSSARPVAIPNFAFGGGRRGTMIANTGEYIVPNFSNGGSAIFNPNMIAQYGMPAGAKPIRGAGGYVPNFVGGGGDINKAIQTLSGMKKIGRSYSEQDQATMASIGKQFGVATKGYGPASIAQRLDRKKGSKAVSGTFMDVTAAASMLVPQVGATRRDVFPFGHSKAGMTKTQALAKKILGREVDGAIMNIYGPSPTASKEAQKGGRLAKVEDILDESLRLAAENVIMAYSPALSDIPVSKQKVEQRFLAEGGAGAMGAFKGALFEAIVQRLLNQPKEKGKERSTTLDVRFGVAGGAEAKDLFGIPDTDIAQYADLKSSASTGNKNKILEQVLKNHAGLVKITAGASQGYIPNFAALGAAVEREAAAGVPLGAIRIDRSSRLVTPNNPAGLAVTNTRDEPRGLRDVFNASKGYIPNFASPADFLKGIVSSKNPAFNKVVKMMEQFGQELTEGKINQDQYNANVKAATQKMGMNKTQMSRVNAAAGKFAVATEQAATAAKANKGGFMGGAGGMGMMMGLTMGLPMAAGALEQAGASREVTGALTGAGTGASIGMIFGPMGAAVGATIGGLGKLAYEASKVGVSLEELEKDLSEFDKTTKETTTAGEAYVQAQQDMLTAGSQKELEKAQKNAADALERIKGTQLEKSFADAGNNVESLTDSLASFVGAQEAERKGRRLVSAGKRFELQDTTFETRVFGNQGGMTEYTVAEDFFGFNTREAFIEQFGDVFKNLTKDQIEKLEAGAKKGLPTLGIGGGLAELRPVLRELLGNITEAEMSDEKLNSIFSPAMIEGLKRISTISKEIDKRVKDAKDQSEKIDKNFKELTDSLVGIRRDVTNAATMIQSSPLMKFKDAFNKLNSAFTSVSSDILTITGDLVGAAQMSATSGNLGRRISQLQTRRGFGSTSATDVMKAFDGAVNNSTEGLDTLRSVTSQLATDPKQGLKALQNALSEEGGFRTMIERDKTGAPKLDDQGNIQRVSAIADPAKFIALENLEKQLQARFQTQEANIEAENLVAGLQNKINIRKAEINEQQRDLNAQEKINNQERATNLRLEQIATQARLDAIRLEKSDTRRDVGLTRFDMVRRQQKLDRKSLAEEQLMARKEADSQQDAIRAEFAINEILIKSNYDLVGTNEELKNAVELLARKMIGSAAPGATRADYDAAFENYMKTAPIKTSKGKIPRSQFAGPLPNSVIEEHRKDFGTFEQFRSKTQENYANAMMDTRVNGNLKSAGGNFKDTDIYKQAEELKNKRISDIDKIYDKETKEQSDSFEASSAQALALEKEKTEFSKGLRDGFDTIFKDIDQIYNRLGKDLPTAFKNGMVNALEASLDKAETFGDAMRGVAIDMLKMIRRASLEYSMSNFTSLIGMGASKGFRESGTRLQNGAFVPGTGSGDRVPAMLEPGEYVMNRKAVAGIGKANLDKINFGMLPRFSNGGSMMLNESVKSSRMSGFFLASDNPELEEAREAERARLARKEAKKAEKKQLLSTFLTTLATVGVGKLSGMAADAAKGGLGKVTHEGGKFGAGTTEFKPSLLQRLKGARNVFGDNLPAVGGAAEYGSMLAQRGGHIGRGFTNRDSVPAYMAGGEFVMNNRAVRKYGLGLMGRLNGGLIPTMQAGGMAGAESAPLNAQTAANTNNISINVTVGGGGSGGGQGGTEGTGNANASQRTNVDQATQGKELSERIRGAVLEVIQQEQRLGGSLSQSSRQ